MVAGFLLVDVEHATTRIASKIDEKDVNLFRMILNGSV